MYANGPIVTKTVGTVCYAAPELLTSGMLTRAADVYSFGAPGLLLRRHHTAYTVHRVLDPMPSLQRRKRGTSHGCSPGLGCK